MDWPIDLIPYRWDFYLQPNTRSFVSPLTRTRQVLIGQGPRWLGTGQFRFRGRRLEQRFEALLDKMKGQAVAVNVWDFAAKYGLPLGPALDMTSLPLTYFYTPGSPGGITMFASGGSPTVLTGFSGGPAGVTVYGSHAIGDDLVAVLGFPRQTTQLYAGDNVQIGRFLYRLTEDATADDFSVTVLSLNRGLIEAAAHGDELVLTRPRTPMQLIDDDQTKRSVGVDHLREYTVSLQEVLI